MSTTGKTAEWLFGRTRARLLAHLFAHAEQTFFLRQLARQAGSSAGSTGRELKLLVQQGWIGSLRDGTQVRYFANRQHPAYLEMKGLLAKTTGFVEAVRACLSGLQREIDFAFIYGSFARGSDTPASDVDVAVVGRVSLMQVVSAFADLEVDLGRSINPVVYTREELEAGLDSAKHFPKALLASEKIMLIGDQDELRGLGQLRLAGTRA